MPYRKVPLVNNEIYHIIIKRIGDELLFKDINDYYRGIFSIYEFNNANPVRIFKRRQVIQAIKNKFRERAGQEAGRDPSLSFLGQGRVSSIISPIIIPDERDKLVELLAFCFMPNHIHLLVRQLKDNGISTYMKKMGGGYARYFKDRYEIKRRGYFFQGRFTSVHIKDDNQLRVVFIYIHVNPLSLIESKWKEIGIKNPEKAIKFLEEKYRWSSFQDHIGKPNFVSVTERDFILELMDGEKGCRDAVEDWIKHKGEIKEFPEIALE